MDTSDPGDSFQRIIYDALRKINLKNKDIGGLGEKLVSSTQFENFNMFINYFKQLGQHRTSEKPTKYDVGNTIEKCLNNFWNTEKFQFYAETSEIDFKSGDFHAEFVGKEHFIRVHAYTFKDGSGSKHVLDVYARKTHMSCFESLCCC